MKAQKITKIYLVASFFTPALLLIVITGNFLPLVNDSILSDIFYGIFYITFYVGTPLVIILFLLGFYLLYKLRDHKKDIKYIRYLMYMDALILILIYSMVSVSLA